MSATEQLEWIGAIVGITDASLLALNTSFSRYGGLFFLIANGVMIGFALNIGANGLLIQQIAFSGTSLLGMYRTGLLPFFKPAITQSGEA